MNTEDFIDVAKRVLNIIFLKHPTRAVAGGLVGSGIVVVHTALSTWLMGRGKGPLYEGAEWHFFLLGMLGVYTPVIYNVALSAPEFDEDIETAFRAIDRAAQKGVPPTHVRLMYRQLCEKLVDRVAQQRNMDSVMVKAGD